MDFKNKHIYNLNLVPIEISFVVHQSHQTHEPQ